MPPTVLGVVRLGAAIPADMATVETDKTETHLQEYLPPSFMLCHNPAILRQVWFLTIAASC